MMSNSGILMQIQGWGNYPRIDAHAALPLTYTAAQTAVKQAANGLIAHGMGRSYGDCSLATQIINTRYLNFLLDFDEATGVLRCGAGITLAELLQVFVPQGWFLPVTPGTKFVTVGGAIASDVHGKNHHLQGCFSEYVNNFKLLLADGEIAICSRQQNAELFYATCGGMGLTGIILEASIHLKQIKSTFIEQTTLKATNLAEVLALFEENAERTYSVAWIDCLATHKSLGRSLLMLGEHAEDVELILATKRTMSIPCNMPALLLNNFSIKAFNTLYYHRIYHKQTKQRVHYERFFYPLDNIQHWNRLYGKNGFIQYQLVLPKEAGKEGISNILQKIAASRRGSFLAVLKLFGCENANLLSFPMEGYTLALDFKLDDGLFKLLDELDAMVTHYSGRLYLTKDARMSEATFKRSYPKWELLQTIREKYNAKGKFVSLQSKRLGLD